MSENNVVLVGVDGSRESLNALDFATDYAKRKSWGLLLANVHGYPLATAGTIAESAAAYGAYAEVEEEALEKQSQQVLTDAANSLSESGIPVETVVASGDASAALIELSKRAALTVVGARGKGGFVDRLLGTVSSALPAHAHSPVVVVPTPPEGKEQTDNTARAGIIVGTDGSDNAQVAVEAAADWAADANEPLVLVSAAFTTTSALGWVSTPIEIEERNAEAQKQLDAVVENLKTSHSGLNVTGEVVAGGAPAKVLIEKSKDAKLLVVGTRGHGGFTGLLLGSTSQAVLHHSKAPVLVVRENTDK